MCSITTKRYIFNFELNRRVPNGMHGGVRGRSKSALLDLFSLLPAVKYRRREKKNEKDGV